MDNLKLGYGGTQLEMARLINDTGVMGKSFVATAKNINEVPFDKIVEGIHKVQHDLGVTGTTADEAAKTISGSASAMKAAFSNVLGRLTLGEDIRPALQALASTTMTFLVGNLLPAVLNIVKGFPAAIQGLLQSAGPALQSALVQAFGEGTTLQGLLQQGAAMAQRLVQGIGQALPQVAAKAQELLSGLVQGLTAAMPMLLGSGAQMIATLVTALYNAVPTLLGVGAALIPQLVQGVLSSMPAIFSAAQTVLQSFVSGATAAMTQLLAIGGQMIAQILTGLITNLPQIIQGAFELITTLVQGLGAAAPLLIDAAAQMGHTIMDALRAIDWISLGADIIRGIISGITSSIGALVDAAISAAKAAFNAAKNALGIHSPSRVFRDKIGKMIPAGMAEGILDNGGVVRKAMSRLGEDALGVVTIRPAVVHAMRSQQRSAGLAGGAAGRSWAQTNNFYINKSMSEAELTREAEAMGKRMQWAIP